MRTLVYAIGIALLGTSCSPNNPRSDIQHTFGKTRREPNKPLEVCEKKTPADATLAAAQSYIQHIAYFIMQKNPQTFSGIYAPEKFCFEVVDSFAVNANADPNTGKITFYTGLLEVMQNDGNIAAVMAHELAHVTLRHDEDTEKEEVANDPRWKSEAPTLKNRLTSLRASDNNILKNGAQLRQQRDSLDDQLNLSETESLAQKRAQLEQTYQDLSLTISSHMGRDDGDAYMALLSKMTYPLPRIPDAADLFDIGDIPTPSTAEYNKLSTAVVQYEKDRAAWIAEDQQTQASLWQQYNSVSASLKQNDDALAKNMLEKDRTLKSLDDLRAAVIGNTSHNWREEEADDVGLEFFLRAGLAPLNFFRIFDVFDQQHKHSVASCAVQNESAIIERGDDSHPAACWRYYNAQVLEMSDHAADYKVFIDTALATEIAGDQLAKLKEALSNRTPSSPW